MSPNLSMLLPEQFQAAVDAAEIGVWNVSVPSGTILLSDIGRSLLGINQMGPYTLDDLFRHVHPGDLPDLQACLQLAVDGQQRVVCDREYRVVQPGTGTVLRWVRMKGKASFDEHGKAVSMSGIISDVSHRKRIEQDLEQSVSEFRLLADSLPQVVWTAQPNGFVDYWNKRWHQLTGAVGEGDESWMPVVHPEDAPKVTEVWQHSLQTGDSYKIEARIYDHAKGEYRWYLGMAFPVHDQAGNILKWFGTNTDIHEQKLAATVLEQKVQERTAQLERSNRELEQFAYVASHDLQEPLRKIRTFISLLETRSASLSHDEVSGYMDRIKGSAHRMSALITDLLNLSHLVQDGEQWQQVDLCTTVQQVCADLELMIGQKRARITWEPLPVISGIPLQLNQLLFNLLQNALKFSVPNVEPQVHLAGRVLSAKELSQYPDLDSGKRYLYLTVQDNGIGFNPTHKDRIFGMFQRLQGKDGYEGTGIGLALCKKVVDNHRGIIEADSQPGKGTTMTIVLPVD